MKNGKCKTKGTHEEQASAYRAKRAEYYRQHPSACFGCGLRQSDKWVMAPGFHPSVSLNFCEECFGAAKGACEAMGKEFVKGGESVQHHAA